MLLANYLVAQQVRVLLLRFLGESGHIINSSSYFVILRVLFWVCHGARVTEPDGIS